MSDERYDRSADMRLLELQREALGVPARTMRTRSYTDFDPFPDALTDDDDDEEVVIRRGAVIVATLEAQPRRALIAGAVVTVSLVVANDGDIPARGVHVALPLPGDTAYRANSFALDGTLSDDTIAEDLFANGVELGDIESGTRRTIVVKLSVEAALSDLILSAQVSASGGAILGPRALRLTRGSPTAQRAPERPFYEEDDAEAEVEPRGERDLRPRISIVQSPEFPPPPKSAPKWRPDPDLHSEPETPPGPGRPVAPLPRTPLTASPPPSPRPAPPVQAPPAAAQAPGPPVAPQAPVAPAAQVAPAGQVAPAAPVAPAAQVAPATQVTAAQVAPATQVVTPVQDAPRTSVVPPIQTPPQPPPPIQATPAAIVKPLESAKAAAVAESIRAAVRRAMSQSAASPNAAAPAVAPPAVDSPSLSPPPESTPVPAAESASPPPAALEPAPTSHALVVQPPPISSIGPPRSGPSDAARRLIAEAAKRLMAETSRPAIGPGIATPPRLTAAPSAPAAASASSATFPPPAAAAPTPAATAPTPAATAPTPAATAPTPAATAPTPAATAPTPAATAPTPAATAPTPAATAPRSGSVRSESSGSAPVQDAAARPPLGSVNPPKPRSAKAKPGPTDAQRAAALRSQTAKPSAPNAPGADAAAQTGAARPASAAAEPASVQRGPFKPLFPQTLTSLTPDRHATRSTTGVPEPRTKPKARAKPKPKSGPPGATPSEPGSTDVSVATAPPRKVDVVRSHGAPVRCEARGGPVLTVTVEGKRLAKLNALFAGPSLGMVAHYLLLNALAARDTLPGDGDPGGIGAFVASQEQLLSRALITTRLGKTPAGDDLTVALPPFPPAVPSHDGGCAVESAADGAIVLVRAFAPTDVAFLRRTISNEKAAPFLRAAQLAVGLCANEVAITDEIGRRRAAAALATYAALATAEISRIFLRSKLKSAPVFFKETDAALDDAARSVLAAIGSGVR